jgi:hypothetical protein
VTQSGNGREEARHEKESTRDRKDPLKTTGRV